MHCYRLHIAFYFLKTKCIIRFSVKCTTIPVLRKLPVRQERENVRTCELILAILKWSLFLNALIRKRVATSLPILGHFIRGDKMASIILTLACVGLIFYRVYKYMFTKPDNFPPGPPRLPWLGSYPFMLLLNYRHLHRAIDWLCKFYTTDVLGLYAANFLTIVANTAATSKELLNNPDLDGKPQLLLASLRDPEFTIRGIWRELECDPTSAD